MHNYLYHQVETESGSSKFIDSPRSERLESCQHRRRRSSLASRDVNASINEKNAAKKRGEEEEEG